MVKVIGFQDVNFTPKDSTQPIIGTSLYVTHPQDKVTGEVAEKVFVSPQRMAGYIPKVGDTLNILYNRYGKVDTVELVKG